MNMTEEKKAQITGLTHTDRIVTSLQCGNYLHRLGLFKCSMVLFFMYTTASATVAYAISSPSFLGARFVSFPWH